VREGDILSWRGIPYAAPPVGDLRFRAPQPVRPWAGVRDASDFGNVAMQAYRGQFRGVGPGVPAGEDCLTVNVFARGSGDLPVLVFIHGGGYSAGSSRDFPGGAFVSGDRAVFVSFNYRLGALGYLDFSRYSTPERPIDSNLGLRDQIAALEWVRTNIAAFGGDPDRITVFGESAGGNAVTTLLATPRAKGLFSRAIAESSPANAVYPPELTSRWAGEFVEILRGGDGTRARQPLGTADAVQLLTRADASALVNAAITLQVRTPDADPGTFCLAPVVDGDLLPEHPMTAFREGRQHRVPLIIGTNDREGALFRGRIDILPRSAGRIRALFQQAPKAARPPMRAVYTDLPTRHAAADFGGDYAFWYPSVRLADYHSRVAPVWASRFDLAPRALRVVGLHATHGVELLALFDRMDDPVVRAITAIGGRGEFSRAGARMRHHWLKFAAAAAPGADWPAYDEARRLTLVFNQPDHVESDPRRERRLAWQAFLPGV
jgi:para-nitrobenzyl esterase